MDIGFIGLGAMGRGMATNLLKAGHRVRVWNRSPEPARALVEEGAVVVASPAEAFRGDAVISMLADDAALREVLLDSGVLARAPRGLIHVNMATISVSFADEFAAAHLARAVFYVAATVLGRPDVASAGKLNIIAAGPANAIERVQPLLDAIGQTTWRMGDKASNANVIKLAANFMLGAAVEAIAEASALVTSYGIAPADLLNIVTNTNFPGPVYMGYGKLIADSRYEPAGFKAKLEWKDIRLALDAGAATHTPLPIGSVVSDSLTEALAAGSGDKDVAVLGEIAQRRAGRG